MLQQIVVQAFAEGWRVREVPFHYQPREHGSSSARVLPRRAWPGCARSASSGCSETRSSPPTTTTARTTAASSCSATGSASRHRHVMELIAGEGPVLDVGCGSSRIIDGLPPGSVARRRPASQASLRPALQANRSCAAPASRCRSRMRPSPASSARRSSSTCPKESPILDELCRVLAPGGRLVLGTPDYANWQWVYIEKLYGLVPGGYKDEHISHYTNRELVAHHGRARSAVRGRALHPAGRADSGVSETQVERVS